MVRAWIADVTPLCEDRCYREYYDRLPDFRKEKADALRAVKMKVQSVGAWMLWEKIRALHGLHSGAAFNLSHSGTYVMCAAELDGSSERVGCDLEKIGALKEKPGGIRSHLQRKNRGSEDRAFLQVLGLKGEFYEGDQKGDGSPDGFFLHPHGRTAGTDQAAGRIPGTVPLCRI